MRAGFAQATDLAEELSRAAGLAYRSAYRVVGRAVAGAADAGARPEALDPGALDAAAREVLGRPIAVDAALVAEALDPAAALATRTVPGGAAPEPMDAMLGACRAAIERAARGWRRSARRSQAAEARAARARPRRG